MLSPSKTVKFFDENTLERKMRKHEIKQGMALETIVSGSEGEEGDSGDEEGGLSIICLSAVCLSVVYLLFVCLPSVCLSKLRVD